MSIEKERPISRKKLKIKDFNSELSQLLQLNLKKEGNYKNRPEIFSKISDKDLFALYKHQAEIFSQKVKKVKDKESSIIYFSSFINRLIKIVRENNTVEKKLNYYTKYKVSEWDILFKIHNLYHYLKQLDPNYKLPEDIEELIKENKADTSRMWKKIFWIETLNFKSLEEVIKFYQQKSSNFAQLSKKADKINSLLFFKTLLDKLIEFSRKEKKTIDSRYIKTLHKYLKLLGYANYQKQPWMETTKTNKTKKTIKDKKIEKKQNKLQKHVSNNKMKTNSDKILKKKKNKKQKSKPENNFTKKISVSNLCQNSNQPKNDKINKEEKEKIKISRPSTPNINTIKIFLQNRKTYKQWLKLVEQHIETLVKQKELDTLLTFIRINDLFYLHKKYGIKIDKQIESFLAIKDPNLLLIDKDYYPQLKKIAKQYLKWKKKEVKLPIINFLKRIGLNLE